MPKTIVLLTCLTLALQVHAQNPMEIKGTPAELSQYLAGVPRTVTITGDGEIKKTADRALITLKISTEHKSLQEAMRLNQDIRAKVQEQLKNGGVAADRVQAAKFASTPQFGWFSDKAKSYKIENSVKVTVADEKEFQAVSGAVDKYPEVQFIGFEFEHANKEELKKQVVAKACDNAIERRKLYEEKFGVRLVAKAVSEGAVATKSPQTTAPYRRSGDDTGVEAPSALYGKSPTYMTSISATHADGIAEGISPFGELVYTTRVVVDYVVESK